MSAVHDAARPPSGRPRLVSEAEMTDERQRLRRTLGAFATGVTIVTTRIDGVAHGLTVNSFASVSLDPPLVLWSLDKRSTALDAFSRAEGFAINVLARGQADLARRFGRAAPDRFAGVAAEDGLFGAPLLADCAAAFQCRRVAVHEGGDHLIFVGEVLAHRAEERAPLIFHGGVFGGFSI